MTTIPPQFHIQTQPVADPAAMVQIANVRFTWLTERLVRLEYSPSGEFEDHPSQAFWFRKQPVPQFNVKQTDTQTEIENEFLLLRYRVHREGFTRKTLSIQVKATGAEWHYGQNVRNTSAPLFGTVRTLDDTSGAVRLELGPLGRAGWSIIDDSRSVVFNEDYWVQPRQHPENIDLYFFGYGHDYVACL